ncbi:MAG: methyltransferase [Chloroflexi bacterium]|nr:methyltransferase [Chloroflexota bacterium]
MTTPNSTLFSEYVRIPENSSVLCVNVEDPAYLRDIAATATRVDVFHRDGPVVQSLERRLRRHKNCKVHDTVFPTEDSTYDVALVEIPRGRDFAKALIATSLKALKPGNYLYAAGPNKGGAKTAETDAKGLSQVYSLGTKQRHRLFSVLRPDAIPADWLDLAVPHPEDMEIHGQTYTVHTQPGVFSYNHLDDGTSSLLDALYKIQPKGVAQVLDAGCGYGIVGMVAQQLLAPVRVVFVDTNLLAVQCTKTSVPEAPVLMADVTQDALETYAPFDLILCNPPFHKGVTVERTFIQGFAENATRLMAKQGQLLVVFNTFLPYEDVLKAHFATVTRIIETNTFTVVAAQASM